MLNKIFNAVFGGSNGTVNINGVEYSGKNISITGDSIVIDGKSTNYTAKVLNVTVTSYVQSLVTGSGDVTVTGDVGSIQTGSGDVEITGNIDIVSTGSGDVTANRITHATSMSGDVTHG